MRLFFFVAGAFVAGIVLAAPAPQPPPSARAVDLKATDGAVLKATYFAAAKPGPGVLFHQSNRTRKEWDMVARQLAAARVHTLSVDSVLRVSPLGPDRRAARRALLRRRFSQPYSRLALLQRSRIQLVVSLLENDFLE